MPVVTDEGLVGKNNDRQQYHLDCASSYGRKLQVAASVEGTREQGIVSGERVSGGLAPLLDLNFLTKQANLQPGQKAYTSGVGGGFSVRFVHWDSEKLSRSRTGRSGETGAGSGSVPPWRTCSWSRDGNDFLFHIACPGGRGSIAEFFIPPLDWMYHAHIYIAPVLVFYGAMALPFP